MHFETSTSQTTVKLQKKEKTLSRKCITSISANQDDFYLKHFDDLVTKLSFKYEGTNRATQACFTTMIGVQTALILFTTIGKYKMI